jgi:putative aldouronate transport system permease protein
LEKGKRFRFPADDAELSLLALPAFLWYVLFSYLPMFGIVIAFKNFKIKGNFISSILSSEWAGFANFRFLFSSSDAGLAVRNTLGYNAVFIILGTVLPVGFALMISQLHSSRAKKVFQTAMFMPYFLSWVVISAVVWAFLSYDHGLFNTLAESMGFSRSNWYMKKEYWPFILIFLNVWKNLGYGMVVYLAAIAGVDQAFYEAAVIDGATPWQQTWKITLPSIKTVVVLMFILSMGRVFYSDFGLFYQVPRDSNSLFTVTNTIDVMVYKSLKSATVGMASASALFQSVAGCITILAANFLVRKVDPESAMI